MKTAVSIFLLFAVTCLGATPEVPYIDRKKLNKEHGDKEFGKWDLHELPYTIPNQRLVSEVISLCFQDIQRIYQKMGVSQQVIDTVSFARGYWDPKKDLWYLSFGSDTISDSWEVYIYSTKEKKLIGWFAPDH